MNKKANVGIIGAVLLFLIFIVNWFIWLGAWLGNVGASAVTTGNLTGVEAFFMNNLNFIVLVCMFLGMLGWIYFGGGE